jgi:uncharacterized protein (DUF1697 family)
VIGAPAQRPVKYIAFLRAVNVGGRVVKMDVLRKVFESLGYTKVETFIASGNVVFETTARNTRSLETAIEKKLREKLGYDVDTFVRTCDEVAAVATYEPFAERDVAKASAFIVGFLVHPLDQATIKKLMALRTDIDDFHVNGREFYWLSRQRQGESTFSNAVLEKVIGGRSTLRGMNTVRRMAAKWSSSSAR